MRFASCLVAAALLVSSLPAAAQLSPGTSGFSSAPVSASEAEYWSMVRTLGGCLADSKRAQSEAFLATASGTPEESAAFAPLFHRKSNRCMGNFIRASIVRAHIRGSIAEGLFEQMDETQRAQGLAMPIAEPESIRSLHDFARCYVSRHQADAAALLAETKLASKGESEAIRQMSADFSECFPADREVTIVPIDIRMAIAEQLYHAARRPVQTQVVN